MDSSHAIRAAAPVIQRATARIPGDDRFGSAPVDSSPGFPAAPPVKSIGTPNGSALFSRQEPDRRHPVASPETIEWHEAGSGLVRLLSAETSQKYSGIRFGLFAYRGAVTFRDIAVRY